MRATLACSLLLALAPLARAQTSYPCEATPEIREALETANTPPEDSSYEERQQRRLAGVVALLQKYPGDFFVRMAHANLLRDIEREWDDGIAEYRRLLEQRPDDVRRLVYYARILVGRNTPEAIAKLNRALEKAPDFAPAHLVLGEIYQYPNFRDKEKQRRELEHYIRLCPDSLGVYWGISRMDRSRLVEESAVRLRPLVEGRTDREALQAYAPLWTLEFKVAPPNEHAALRKRVEADIERIKSSKAFAQRGLPWVLATGYKLIGKPDEAKRIEEQSGSPFYRALNAFQKEHPNPKAGDPPEKLKEYNRAALEASSGWIAKWPGETEIYSRKLNAMWRIWDEVPAAEVEATCDKLLELTSKTRASAWEDPAAIRVAQAYVAKGIRLDRVPQLVKKGLAEVENPPAMSDLYPMSKESADSLNFSRQQRRWTAWNALAEAAIKSGKPAEARAPLGSMSEHLASNKPGESAPDRQETTYEGNQRAYWRRMGELAEAEDHALDALAWYGKLLASMPEANKQGRSELTAKQRGIWRQLGGTDEGWAAWPASIEPPRSAKAPPGGLQWTKLDKPLPNFELGDIQGKKWTLADLKGKTTLMAVWASW